MSRNRKLVMTAVMLLVMAFTLLAPQGIQPAEAAVSVKEIRLTCNPATVGFDPEDTEGQVNTKIRDIAGLQSEGVKLNVLNSGLTYWVKTDGEIWGIRDGTDKINPSKDYYFCATIELDDTAAYDWPDDMKALQEDKYYPVTSCSVPVYLNGAKRTDATMKCFKYSDPMYIRVYIPFGPEMASCKAVLSETAFTYDGQAHKPDVKSLTLYGKDVPEEYRSFSYMDAGNKTVAEPVNAGKYYAVFTGKGMYRGTYKTPFTVAQADNTMTAKGKKLTVKAKKLAKKKQTVKSTKVIKIRNAVGKVTFKKLSGNRKITVSSSGKITVKKGLKPGKYKIKVKVSAAGDENYKPKTKKVIFTIVVK